MVMSELGDLARCSGGSEVKQNIFFLRQSSYLIWPMFVMFEALEIRSTLLPATPPRPNRFGRQML